MIDRVTAQQLRSLAEVDDTAAATVTMPTYEAGREVRQNSIRFDNLTKRVREMLQAVGLSREDINVRLEQPEALAAHDSWWQNQSKGLVLFLADGVFERFRLPKELDESALVGQHFHLRPLIPMEQEDGTFYVLAVSQNRVRLLRGSRYDIETLEPEDLPGDLNSALNVDEYTQSIQHHMGERPGVVDSGIFHGHGGADMDVQKQDELRRYFQVIGDAIDRYLAEEKYPLVFAGVDYLFPLFRDACKYPQIAETHVSGSPDECSEAELRDQAWSAVRPIFLGDLDDGINRYHREAGGERASTDLTAILTAARNGIVDTLLLGEGEVHWGRLTDTADLFEFVEQEVPGACDLLNEAAVQTLRTGGRVLECPLDKMPDRRPIAAVLRAPVRV